MCLTGTAMDVTVLTLLAELIMFMTTIGMLNGTDHALHLYID